MAGGQCGIQETRGGGPGSGPPRRSGPGMMCRLPQPSEQAVPSSLPSPGVPTEATGLPPQLPFVSVTLQPCPRRTEHRVGALKRCHRKPKALGGRGWETFWWAVGLPAPKQGNHSQDLTASDSNHGPLRPLPPTPLIPTPLTVSMHAPKFPGLTDFVS